MLTFFRSVYDFVFDCHHRHLSRVFTLQGRTYRVCADCGSELPYSWEEMSLAKQPPVRGPQCRPLAENSGAGAAVGVEDSKDPALAWQSGN